jgi:hypothetical protein
MINTSNYFEKAKGIDFSKLPDNLVSGHNFVLDSTENGKDWGFYHEDKTIKKVIDGYFSKLETYLSEHKTVAKKEQNVNQAPKKERSIKKSKGNKSPIKSQSAIKTEEDDITYVERIPEEIRFIKRYLVLNEKSKTKDELLPFIKSLQKAIVEKRIRKTSPYHKQIEYIQEKLINAYNTFKGRTEIKIQDKVLNEFSKIVAEEKVMPAVQLIKKYIRLNGQSDVKDKAKKLFEQMKKFSSQHQISKTDKNWQALHRMYKNLEDYIKNNSKVLEIESSELNGLNGFLEGCNCESLSGVDIESTEISFDKPQVMNSIDFANMRFPTIGFTGKYFDLIGDPAPGFTVMVYGKPKMGKSMLCIDFAKYLAQNHGKVLYVAKEEGLYKTLQDKIKEIKALDSNMDVANNLLSDLRGYDFIFLDSVNKLELTVNDLNNLKRKYPKASFIYVFQSTKDGNFRGVNEFQHEVDSVIEVPQLGKAVQFGRFNQGGEMNIFS